MDNKRRVTIRDLARETGYSIATVSRVINQTNKYYSEETRQKILEAAKRLDYVPDLVAKGLKERRTYNLAFLAPQIDEFYASIINYFQEEANKRGYSVAIFSSDYNQDTENVNIKHIREKRYDGVIIATGLLDKEKNDNISAVFPGVPIVLIEGIKERDGIASVGINVEELNKNATEHLLALGHKRIAYVSAPLRFDTLEYRYKGYRRAFEENGLKVDPSLVFFNSEFELTRYNECYMAMKQIIENHHFTAVLVMSDWAAFTAIGVAKAKGLRVPQDLSIIGFDNLPFTEFSEPKLTSISQNSLQVGKQSALLMFEMLEHNKCSNVMIEGEVIYRDSVAAPG